MSNSEIPAKSRRKKKSEVPVHKSSKSENKEHQSNYKTYSAQFNHKHKTKHKHVQENIENDPQEPSTSIAETDRSSQRVSKKSLISINEQLYVENQQLNQKLKEIENYFDKKLSKIKEKLSTTQKFNEDVVEENGIIKTQYQDLLIHFEECKNQLEDSKVCKGCEELRRSLENCVSSNRLLQNSNKELNEDISMLKNVVYRLNVQMERYQEKLRKSNVRSASSIQEIQNTTDNRELITHEVIATLSESHLHHAHIPISWGNVNSHTLGPLLDAYQETIAEKEEIIQNYEMELSHFTGQLQQIMKENEELHKKLTVDDECSAKLSIELEKYKTELKSTKEQNDLLIKKCSLKQDKLEEVLKCYEQKVEQLKRDYNVVVEQYHKSRAEVSVFKERNKSLIDSQDEFKTERQNYIPVSVHTASVNECKRWYEELKQQYEEEKSKLKELTVSLQAEIQGGLKNVEILSGQKVKLETKIKSYEQQIKKHETQYLDLQHTLNEVQLSRSACRKQLHKAMNFAKDLVAEQEALLQTLHMRQQENKAVKRIGSDIALRMDSLRSQLKTVQKDAWHELSSVEQKLQNQDSVIIEMKRAHEEEIEKLRDIIKQKEGTNLLLKNNYSSTSIPHYLLLKDRNINTN